MAAPTISLSRLNLRPRIARRLDDNINGTAAGGSATTMTATGDIARLSTSPGSLIGAETSIITGTGSVQSRFNTAHAVSAGTVTLTVASWTAPDSTSTYEIHKLNGRGFTKAQYDDAINAAIDSLADSYSTDIDNIYFAIERFGTAGERSEPRHEYPMPSGFNYLTSVDYLGVPASASSPLGNMDAFRAIGDATARTRVWQGFKVPQDGFYQYFSVALNKIASPTDNLILDIQTNSSGIPSGTVVTDATSDNFDGSTVDERNRYIVFQMNPPIFLTGGTQYHWTLRRSGALSSTNYWRVAEDTGNNYGDGTAGTYDATTYTAVSGSDFCFVVFPATTLWIPFARSHWQYRRVGADFIFLPYLPWDGCPVRLRGLGPIAEVSTETATVPIRPEYVEAFAIDYLLSGRVGQAAPDNYGAGAKAWAEQMLSRPRPIRSLPANAVKIYA